MALEKNDFIKYSYDEVYNATLNYFNNDILATDVWIKKYCLKDSEGNLYEKTPDDMHKRIAKELARIELKYPNALNENKIYETLKNFNRIVPQGSPMSGIGNNFQIISLGNCFVTGNEKDSDSYGGIMRIDQNIAQLEKRRGGVGVDLSFIRPNNSPVKNSSLTSTGIVPFMERYSNTTKEVGQGNRRGALMLSLSVKHPDAENFIDAKLEQGKVTGANISIKVDDEFMNCVINNKEYIQQYPIDSNNPKYIKNLNANKFWKKLMHNAWKCLPYNTYINILYNNNPLKIKIGELYENKEKYKNSKILSINLSNLKLENKEIIDFQKYKNNKKIISLKTKNNNFVSSTEDHIFYILKNEKIIETNINDINIGDFILTSKKNIENNYGCDYIKLNLEFFEKRDGIWFENIPVNLKDDKIKKILKKYKNDEYILNGYIRRKLIPLNSFNLIKDNLNIVGDIYIRPNTTNNSEMNYSINNFHIDENLSRFFGLWLADGSYHGSNVRISSNEKEINDYKKIYDYISKKFKCNYSINKEYTVEIGSKFLVNLMKSLGFCYVNGNKILPKFIKSMSNNNISNFIGGFIDGDGTVSKEGTITINQSNFELLNDIKELLMYFSVYSSIYPKIIKEGKIIKNNYILSIQKFDNKIFINDIKLLIKNKYNRIKTSKISVKTAIPIPPIRKLIENCKFKNRMYFYDGGISKYTLKKHLNSKNIHNTFLESLCNEDIYFDKVIEKKEENNQEYVYDITVKDNHTFVLSNGIILSNSAEPGILFWDTIINESVADCYSDLGFKTVSTNPCQPAWAKILTPKGIKELKDVNIGDEIWSSEGWTKIINKWSTGIKKVYKYSLDFNKKIPNTNLEYAFYGTENHKIVDIGKKIEVDNAKNIDCFLNNVFDDFKTNFTDILSIEPLMIKNKEFISEEEVFDITVDNNSHTYWTQGCNVSNCGELPLCISDSCRLLLLNLFGYVINPFTKDSYFNFDLFKKDVYIAQRYMDDINDLEIEKIESILNKIKSDPEDEFIKLYEIDLWEKIKEKLILGRRTGLGITGEGDMLAALGYRYGTDEATDFCVNVHKILKLEAYRSSVDMAKERGKFSIYDSIRELNNPFINRIKNEDIELYNNMVKYGRRNIALLTIAPAGSVSICTQTTSGIEPVFLPTYKRRRKINPQEKNIRIDFIDPEGIAWQEYNVFHHKFELWLKINGYDIEKVKLMSKEEIDEIIKLSPYYKATSNDLNWVKKIEMQGKIQKHVDHSISVTCNLPSDVNEEIVSKVYETGWKFGCKGVTIYRDGSRNGVLVSNDNKNEKTNNNINENNAPKRPKKLKGDIIRFQNNSEKWIGVVGLYKDKPYEIFTGKLENGLSVLPSYVKTCEIVKNIIEDENGSKKKRYDIEYIDLEGKKQISTGLSHKFNPEFWNYAKMISGLLRHGMPLISLYKTIDSLNLDDTNLNTWKAGILRIIKKYIKDGEKLSGYKCQECGSDQLEFKEGCLTCMNCGNSKCG